VSANVSKDKDHHSELR